MADASPSNKRIPSNPQGHERRRFARFRVDGYRISIQRTGLRRLFAGAENLAIELVDLSEGGAQVSVRGDLPKGTRIRFSLHLDKFNDGFEAQADVRWVRSGQRQSRVGIEFVDVDKALQRKIAAMYGWFTSEQYRMKKLQERHGEFRLPP